MMTDSAPLELVDVKVNHWCIIVVSDGVGMNAVTA